MSANPLPEQAINPPEVEPQTKAITVYVRFAGVDKVEMEVPVDFDLTDSRKLTDYMNEWTREHRPWTARNVHDPENYEYINYILGEFWQESKWNPNRKTFNDPEQGGSQPRIYIEGVEE